jgi:hypothetical protein
MRKKDRSRAWRNFVISKRTVRPEPIFEDNTESIERSLNLNAPGREMTRREYE